MIKRERIEKIVKSSVGQLIYIKKEHGIWLCEIKVPRDPDRRIKPLQGAFPHAEIRVSYEDNLILCAIPQDEQPMNGNVPEAFLARSHQHKSPSNFARALIKHEVGNEATPVTASDATPLSLQAQINQIAGLYSMVFDDPCEATIEGKFIKFVFQRPLRYPFGGEILSLIDRYLPGYSSAGVYGENVGNSDTTALFFASGVRTPSYDHDFVTIHIDGGHRDKIGAYGVRYLLKDHLPGYLAGVINSENAGNTELAAFLNAVAHLDQSVPRVQIFTDSTFVIHWLRKDGKAWMDRLQKRHKEIKIQHIPRSNNHAAHQLATRMLKAYSPSK